MNEEKTIATRMSLLERLKDWDNEESWRDFFETYWRLIYSVAVRAGLKDDEARDVVQETVLSVAKHIGDFQYDPAVCSFKTWMLRSTRWKIANQFKKRPSFQKAVITRSKDHTATDLVDRIPDPAGLEALETMWEEEWVRHVFNLAAERVKRKVRPQHFQIFDLYAIQEWPVDKVAQALQIRPAMVRLVKHRISRLMKKEIQKLETSGQTF